MPVLLGFILMLSGVAVSGPVLAAASPPQRHIVEIREFGFHPSRILLAPGETIVWINRDIVPHTATAKDGKWGSPELEEGESWEMVVKKAGMQSYFCEYHPDMRGVLEVHDNFGRDLVRHDQLQDVVIVNAHAWMNMKPKRDKTIQTPSLKETSDD